MNNGLLRWTGRLSRTVTQWLNGAGPGDDQAAELMRPPAPLVLSDTSSLPHDTVCVQDVSGSMARRDCECSRLDASKQASETYIRRRAVLSPDDRVAVVRFNHRAGVVLPLTGMGQLDRILSALAALRVGGGTDIAEGLRAANDVFAQDVKVIGHPTPARCRRLLLLTDGHGGRPLWWAEHLKRAGVLVDVIGVGGDPSAVDEPLLRRVATTDADGFVHYWFFRDTEGLVAHYEALACGLIYRGHRR